jgi:hypothetical protein
MSRINTSLYQQGALVQRKPYSDHATGWHSNPGRDKRSSLLRNVQTGSEAHPASDAMVLGCLPAKVKYYGRKAHHLSPPTTDVKMSGSIPHIPLHTPIAYTRITLPFFSISKVNKSVCKLTSSINKIFNRCLN